MGDHAHSWQENKGICAEEVHWVTCSSRLEREMSNLLGSRYKTGTIMNRKEM
jgi:hypothetical protein